MSVWKKINKQDAFITTYVAKKSWNLSGDQLDTYGVKLLPAYSKLKPVVETVQEVPLDFGLLGTFLGYSYTELEDSIDRSYDFELTGTLL